MKEIAFMSIRIIFLIMGFLIIGYAYRKKDSIPEKVYGLKDGDFSVRDRTGFNKIMFKKNIIMGLLCVVIGVVSFYDNVFFALGTWAIVINIYFDNKSKKYLVLYKK